jgi:uncharacterized protein (DUF433 family)
MNDEVISFTGKFSDISIVDEATSSMDATASIRNWQRSLQGGANDYVSFETVISVTGVGHIVPGQSVVLAKSVPTDLALSVRLTYSAATLNTLVEITPSKSGGVPVLSGTRFSVAQLLGELADGKSVAGISREFGLKRQHLAELLRGIAIQLDRPLSK